jgi:hypothetical protein
MRPACSALYIDAPLHLPQCEDNYAASRYIAEFFNTISNVPFIALGIYGYYRTRQAGLPTRYGLALLGLSMIGCGSFGFHMTVSPATLRMRLMAHTLIRQSA